MGAAVFILYPEVGIQAGVLRLAPGACWLLLAAHHQISSLTVLGRIADSVLHSPHRKDRHKFANVVRLGCGCPHHQQVACSFLIPLIVLL